MPAVLEAGERKPYRHRGKRETYAGRINIQFPRDLEILEDLYRHRVLTHKQIHLMHFGAYSRAQARITKLFNHKYIHQIIMPTAYNEHGRNPTFNVIDRLGVDLLREHRNPDLTWHYSDRELTDQYLRHAKLLNDFYSIVVRACRSEGYEYPAPDGSNQLIKRTEKEIKAERARMQFRVVSGKLESRPFNPDMYFQINVGGILNSFFVEADNKTEKSSVIKEKFRAYKKYFQSRMYQKRYGQKQPFRVLFITDGLKRIESLKQWAEEDNAGENFWFAFTDNVNPDTVIHGHAWHVDSWATGKYPLFRAK